MKCKLGPKTINCVFLGYAFHSVGYRFLITNSGELGMLVSTIMESKYATSFESEFSIKTKNMSSDEPTVPHEHFNSMEHTEGPHMQNTVENDIIATQKSKRQKYCKVNW
jgi:hypothetical protein